MKSHKILVIDTSVAVKWFFIKDELHLKQADKILEDVRTGLVKLAMPELVKYEIGNVFLNKKLSLHDIEESVRVFYKIPISFYLENFISLMTTVQIAFEESITYYDASFISLAKKLKAELVTDNLKYQKKKISGLKVISLKNYR